MYPFIPSTTAASAKASTHIIETVNSMAGSFLKLEA